MLTFFLSGEIVSGRVLGTQNIILAKGRNGYQVPLGATPSWCSGLGSTWAFTANMARAAATPEGQS